VHSVKLVGAYVAIYARIREMPSRISSWTPTILIEVYHCFPQFLQANAEPRLGHDHFHIVFSSPNTLPLGAILALQNEPQILKHGVLKR
jgi:hypothetical protein